MGTEGHESSAHVSEFSANLLQFTLRADIFCYPCTKPANNRTDATDTGVHAGREERMHALLLEDKSHSVAQRTRKATPLRGREDLLLIFS